MTHTEGCSGASSASAKWLSVDWSHTEASVFRFQLRIAKAAKAKRWGKVKALQRLLTRSHYARLLAVKRVTSNKGKNTPGVDGTVWSSAKQKWEAATSLSCRHYRSKPLRRIYIPKKNGKKRPLGIPTFFDRAIQALFLLAYEPVAEVTADHHSYGFRPKRSAADAIERCFSLLAKRASSRWILEGDIKGCFDNISHSWLHQNLCVEPRRLGQWLKAGFMEKGSLFPTEKGTPQGGIISPCLANGALDGMDRLLSSITKPTDKVHLVRYADDFVITGNSKELLENTIKPAITAFLAKRGLALSEEKTLITSIDQGFDFLGFNLRKYGDKLLIKPSKKGVKSFLDTMRLEVKKSISMPTAELIQNLNRKITGWANYYRHVVAKRTFSRVDTVIFATLLKMVRKKHPKKSMEWIYRKYYTDIGMRRWIFNASFLAGSGEIKTVTLKRAADIPIRRHRQLRCAAIPYDVDCLDYFQDRANKIPQTRHAVGSVNNTGFMRA